MAAWGWVVTGVAVGALLVLVAAAVLAVLITEPSRRE